MKKLISANAADNQRGQAVVEYVLLLVVIVSMILGAKGLFDGANTFISNYVGKYFTCLMDHGELPQLGVVNTTDLAAHKNQSNCTVKFSLANGATLTGAGSGSSSAANAAARTGKNGAANDAATSKQKAADAANSKNKNDSDLNTNNSGGGDSGGGNSPYANGQINRSRSGRGTADGANDLAGKVKSIGDEEGASGFANYGGNYSSERRRPRYKAILGGKMYDEIEKNSKREQRKPVVKQIAKVSKEEGFRPGPRKNAYIQPERKPAVATEERETEFGFAALLKWLMIAGMVIAIIVFFGGQIMNYSNSDS